MKKFRITGIGEILWDMLPDGKMLGGAPANFCFHAKNIGGDATMISAVGKDDLGIEIEKHLKSLGIPAILNHVDRPTGAVSVNISNGMPSYTIHEEVAWDFIKLSEKAIVWIKSSDAICFGSLAQRSDVSSQAIHRALGLVSSDALKVLDINIRQQFYSENILVNALEKANVLKLNDEEMELISPMFHLTGSPEQKARMIMRDFRMDFLALTLGNEGSWLFGKNEQSFLPAPKVQVKDTIGAGDSFTAVMTMGILRKKPLVAIHRDATNYAARVCTFRGATPTFEWHEGA